ncbi:hypothetical protein [Amycolatopsis sp. NPDC021455]|uniref:hypothetical protein n=1 Tax=Amycolatopsis sp. NPDC021455 TaxID=3154901 RepID=UPI003406F45F
MHDKEKGGYKTIDLATLSPSKQADLARRGYRPCPNPSGDSVPHYLPATYADYGDPLVIGLVGGSGSGKTHLLTAMIRETYRGGLGPHRVHAAALDFRRHTAFRTNFVEPFEDGGALPATSHGVFEAADILLLRGPGGTRPVTFVDVAGEDLESTEALNSSTRFLLAVNAVIFVCAPEDTSAPGVLTGSENKSFEMAVERLDGLPGGAARVPASIVVTKSDRLRYLPPADRWLRRHDPALDAARIRAESRDVYAYLHRIGAAASLRPFDAFTRCTLHFASASGGDALPVAGRDGEYYFPRGISPVRVLEPLVAVLAMTGMITGPEADKVGLP